MNAHGLFKKLKNGLPIESKWDLVVIIDKQEKRIAELEKELAYTKAMNGVVFK